MKGLFIFRRDFRLTDNTTLIRACDECDVVYCIFIFDPKQLNRRTRSDNFVEIMCRTLIELESYVVKAGGKLGYFEGKPHEVVSSFIGKVDRVYWNKDYSPYSVYRDSRIRSVCKRANLECSSDHDLWTVVYDKIPWDTRFGFFKRDMFEIDPLPVKKFRAKLGNIDELDHGLKPAFPIKYYRENPNLAVVPGRSIGIRKLENLKWDRDGMESSMLSSYLKCGSISIRECWAISAKMDHNDMISFRTQMIWRQFYFMACIKMSFKSNINQYIKSHYRDFYDSRYNTIRWLNKEDEFKSLWVGKTGFPFIDAAVRQLNKTGFMHNRGRLVVGYFSVKVLRIHPFLKDWGGQEYFSKKLVDCSYALNVGNWRWVASDTLDKSGQRFGKGYSGRPMNVNDFTKWDPNAEYIKKWVPELRDCTVRQIKNYYTNGLKIPNYPRPIVDLKTRKSEWNSMTSGKK
jgi:deoxyribodipyrimidine photo-lyase